MSNNHIDEVKRYFEKSTTKVYIERCTKIESFHEYLEHRYRDGCYYYSAYALMGLKPDDCLVRGNITLVGRKNYHHGWVEFNFDEEEYVFDSSIRGIVSKQDWYTRFNPRVDYKKTQKEILETFLNEKNAFKIHDGFWQFKNIIMNDSKDTISYEDIIAFDKKNGYVPSALALARLEISSYTSEVLRFIAYSEPSG